MSPPERAVFISYAHRYGDWVRVLHANLERCLAHAERPRKVFLDQVDLGVGFSWVRQLQQGIDRADQMVLVATPEAMASPRVDDEWMNFVARHPDWAQGRLQVVMLVDVPLPAFLVGIQRVDFRGHDRTKYEQGLRELCAGLLGHRDRRELPALPEGLEIPEFPGSTLPDALRARLVDWLGPILVNKVYRRFVASELGLERRDLDGYPSTDVAASAALVRATGDDDPLEAACRVAGVLVEELEGNEPEQVAELAVLRAELEERRGSTPEHGLLATWLGRVERDHGTLVAYFQEKAGFEQLEPVYVQLELRTERREADRRHAESRLDRPMGLPDVLALTPLEHAWVTRRWVVRGDPGAGKTTLLRHMAAALASDTMSPPSIPPRGTPSWIPVFESLPRLMREREWLLDRIERQLLRSGSEVCGLATVLDRTGQEGRLLLLLDGLDEVSRDDRDDAEALLRDLAARWPATPIVVSTRPIGYRRPGPEFVELDLLPFDAPRRREFLARWFGRFTGEADDERATEASAGLEADPGLRDLASNPLYLTLMALLIEQGAAPSSHRAELYDQVFQVLLDGKYRPGREAMEAQEAVRGMLRHLAFAMTRDNRDAEPLVRLEARLYQPAADALRNPLERLPRWRRSLRPFLDDVAQKTGILGPHDGDDADWRFWHRTFREALAAEELEGIMRGEGQEGPVVYDEGDFEPTAQAEPPEGDDDPFPPDDFPGHKGGGLPRHRPALLERLLERVRQIEGDESRWAEPYALLAGRVDDADALVRALVEENRALGLRALATAQGLSDATLCDVLALTDDWKERAKVYERLPELVGDPDRTLALLDRLRRRIRNGNDLFFLDLAVRAAGNRWEEYKERAEQLRTRLCDHIPPPSAELFQWVETPHDGRVELWREIPAGRFQMGSPEDEGYDQERPRHEVTIVSSFRMGAVPVTNAQYTAFDPSHGGSDEHHPIVGVTWYEAVSFCRWLSTMASWACGARLPAEEEWEYACRAGTQTRYWSGDSETHLTKVGWYEANSEGRTHRVGEKPANPWGLYDAHGNVWEWTLSPLDDYAGRESCVTRDPAAVELEPVESAGPPSGTLVTRGGSYGVGEGSARAAYRSFGDPESVSRGRGFRVVLPAGPAARAR